MSQSQAFRRNEDSWGVDADRSRRPGVPKELNDENGASGHASHWARLPRQEAKVKVFHTVERPGLTPVFGTRVPPRGLSGLIRAFAYRFSEDKQRHWILLVLADRIDMVEGWGADMLKGRAPALLPRMEFRTADKLRNPKARAEVLRNAAIFVGAAGLVGYWLLSRRRGASFPKNWEGMPDLP